MHAKFLLGSTSGVECHSVHNGNRGRTSVVQLMDVMLNECLLMERLAIKQAFLMPDVDTLNVCYVRIQTKSVPTY